MAVDITNQLRNPGTQFEVTVHDKSFPMQSFNKDEAQLFNEQINQLIMDLDSQVVANVLDKRANTIANVAAFAKHDLDAKVFGGINAGDNEIGFSLLRPGHIRADPSDGSSENDWYFKPDSEETWVDWIGDGSSNDYTVPDDQVLVVLGFTDQESTPTEVSAINVDKFGRNMDMLPQDVNSMRLMDNDTEQQFTSLPTLVGQENDDIHIRLRADRDVEMQPRLFGFTFGLGSFLNTEDY